ncbi:hypothetical protein [Pedobacter sp. L105]|uniref:hypothetical protein n=1 Tax=Pedobacter sp. L105 TaxID=1641871 RepID=UPI00131BBB83|nr:hypothetical protein [Pedobacter sp. L105]
MDEHAAIILKESNQIISRLQILSVFFQEEVVYKIYLRSQVIHQLFENNEQLSIDKLELFHLQFTTSVVELLKKIKKSNEKNVTLIDEEIRLNQEVIEKLNETLQNEQSFLAGRQHQSLKINNSLRNLFEVLSEHSTDFPFVKNITQFSARFAKDFYYTISSDQLARLINYDSSTVYVNSAATIEKKLMGLLCKYDFKTEFLYGLKSGTMVIEIYKFTAIDRYFLFFPSRNLFLFCTPEEIEELDFSHTSSEKAKMIQEMAYKNDQLKSNAAAVKTYIPPEIIKLLQENYAKISDINFLDNLSNFDVQANILKTMLNTDML